MAKRMKFSVFGLPHYTVWHLYEPSADDLKHMERMEEERIAREQAEKADKEKEEKMKAAWDNPQEQWDQDRKLIEDAAIKQKEQEKSLQGGEAGPHAHAGEEEAQGSKKQETNDVSEIDHTVDGLDMAVDAGALLEIS
jgi:mannan polymerase II complex ANP1 subunit